MNFDGGMSFTMFASIFGAELLVVLVASFDLSDVQAAPRSAPPPTSPASSMNRRRETPCSLAFCQISSSARAW